MSDRLLSVAQLAAKWGWHRQRLYRLTQRRLIPFVQMPNGMFFREDDVDAWLASHTVASETPAPTVKRARPATGRTRAEECRALGLEPDHLFAGGAGEPVRPRLVAGARSR